MKVRVKLNEFGYVESCCLDDGGSYNDDFEVVDLDDFEVAIFKDNFTKFKLINEKLKISENI
ncbi:MAG: hypothetical protein ACRCX2_36605 [Paraclostridium sp.]